MLVIVNILAFLYQFYYDRKAKSYYNLSHCYNIAWDKLGPYNIAGVCLSVCLETFWDVLYTAELSQVITQHGLRFHQYADDSQIYIYQYHGQLGSTGCSEIYGMRQGH